MLVEGQSESPDAAADVVFAESGDDDSIQHQLSRPPTPTASGGCTASGFGHGQRRSRSFINYLAFARLLRRLPVLITVAKARNDIVHHIRRSLERS